MGLLGLKFFGWVQVHGHFYVGACIPSHGLQEVPEKLSTTVSF